MRKLFSWFKTAPEAQSAKFRALKEKYGWGFWRMLDEAGDDWRKNTRSGDGNYGQSKCGTIKLKGVGVD